MQRLLRERLADLNRNYVRPARPTASYELKVGGPIRTQETLRHASERRDGCPQKHVIREGGLGFKNMERADS